MQFSEIMLTDSTQCECVCVSLHLCSFSPRGALNMVRHPSLTHPVCPLRRCTVNVRGNRQGLLRVSHELRGMSSFGLSEVLVTCQINISLLSSQHHTHTHTRMYALNCNILVVMGLAASLGRDALTRVRVSVAERSSLMAGR